jgi:hypothetical protein
MELQNFKIRCSAIGKIMTNPRAKSEILSETCKSYLQEWLKQQLYGVEKQIQSKYLSKGLEVEALALDYYAEVKGLGFVLQNVDKFSNEFMTGTPDLIINDLVIDMKASWDCFTFPLFDTDIDKAYWMQLQGYMALTGKRSARLVYTLQNTPEELTYDEVADYSELPSKLRIKEFEIEYDLQFIELVNERVLLCREYVNELLTKLNQ